MLSKKRIISIALVLLMLLAVVTNPTQEQHEAAVKEKAIALFKKQLNYDHQEAIDFAMNLVGNQVINQFLQNNVQVENYYLFSLTKLRWEGKSTIIGGGAFKQVWLSDKIDAKAEEIIAVLKNL